MSDADKNGLSGNVIDAVARFTERGRRAVAGVKKVAEKCPGWGWTILLVLVIPPLCNWAYSKFTKSELTVAYAICDIPGTMVRGEAITVASEFSGYVTATPKKKDRIQTKFLTIEPMDQPFVRNTPSTSDCIKSSQFEHICYEGKSDGDIPFAIGKLNGSAKPTVPILNPIYDIDVVEVRTSDGKLGYPYKKDCKTPQSSEEKILQIIDENVRNFIKTSAVPSLIKNNETLRYELALKISNGRVECWSRSKNRSDVEEWLCKAIQSNQAGILSEATKITGGMLKWTPFSGKINMM